MTKEEVLDFVREMKPSDHVILFYSSREEKYNVLFGYLKAGLERGEATAYIASEDTPEQIKKAMNDYGIDVEKNENSGALKVLDYRGFYIFGKEVSPEKTIGMWKKLTAGSEKNGFNGIRVTGETTCFFDLGLVEQLLEYEKTLGRTVQMPMTILCAYNQGLLANRTRGGNPVGLTLNLIAAHSSTVVRGNSVAVIGETF